MMFNWDLDSKCFTDINMVCKKPSTNNSADNFYSRLKKNYKTNSPSQSVISEEYLSKRN